MTVLFFFFFFCEKQKITRAYVRIYIRMYARKNKKKKKNTIFVKFSPKYAVSLWFGAVFLPFSLFFLFFFFLKIGIFDHDAKERRSPYPGLGGSHNPNTRVGGARGLARWVRVWVRACRVSRICVRLGAFKLFNCVIYRLGAENVLNRKFCTKICKCRKKVVPLQKN